MPAVLFVVLGVCTLDPSSRKEQVRLPRAGEGGLRWHNECYHGGQDWDPQL
jgi:hypothetical protein